MKNKNDILREANLTLSILLLTSWAAHGEGSLHILTSFETKEETELLMPDNREYEVQVEWREESASHGKGSALLSFPPYKEEPEERKHLYWARCALSRLIPPRVTPAPGSRCGRPSPRSANGARR